MRGDRTQKEQGPCGSGSHAPAAELAPSTVGVSIYEEVTLATSVSQKHLLSTASELVSPQVAQLEELPPIHPCCVPVTQRGPHFILASMSSLSCTLQNLIQGTAGPPSCLLSLLTMEVPQSLVLTTSKGISNSVQHPLPRVCLMFFLW